MRKEIYRNVYLKIRITQEEYTFSWTYSDGYGYKELKTIPRILEPKYVGIVAFHGISDEKGRPLRAETIMANFDDFLITNFD